MTEAELDQIERELGVSLPAAYRRMVQDFPIPVSRGETNSGLWDDATWVIKLNQEFRQGLGGGPPWPQHLFFIGDDGSACPYLLDLSQDPPPVLHLEHGDPKVILGGWPDIQAWMKEYLDDIGHLAYEPRVRMTGRQVVLRCVTAVGVLTVIGMVVRLLLS